MIALLDQSAPRSEEVVALTLGKRYQQARARAGGAALRTFAISAAAVVLYGWSQTTARNADVMPYIVAGTLVFCALGAVMNRRVRLRGVALLHTIVRDGNALRATITNHRKRPGHLEILDLAWDGGRARVDLYNVELTGREDVTIVTKEDRVVAAIAGVGVFHAVNTTP